jgi:hypothetical protein
MSDPDALPSTPIHRALLRIAWVKRASKKRTVKTKLDISSDAAGCRLTAVPIPGKAIKANKIVHPSTGFIS